MAHPSQPRQMYPPSLHSPLDPPPSWWQAPSAGAMSAGSGDDSDSMLPYTNRMFVSRPRRAATHDPMRRRSAPGARRYRRMLNSTLSLHPVEDEESDVTSASDVESEDEDAVRFEWRGDFSRVGPQFFDGLEHAAHDDAKLSRRKQKQIESGVDQKEFPPSASMCYRRIDRRIRSSLRRAHDSDFLRELEQVLMLFKVAELRYEHVQAFVSSSDSVDFLESSSFSAPASSLSHRHTAAAAPLPVSSSSLLDPSEGLMFNLKDSYHRMLAHGLCQFHGLKSQSEHSDTGHRVTRISIPKRGHTPHQMSLCQYLKEVRAASSSSSSRPRGHMLGRPASVSGSAVSPAISRLLTSSASASVSPASSSLAPPPPASAAVISVSVSVSLLPEEEGSVRQQFQV